MKNREAKEENRFAHIFKDFQTLLRKQFFLEETPRNREDKVSARGKTGFFLLFLTKRSKPSFEPPCSSMNRRTLGAHSFQKEKKEETLETYYKIFALYIITYIATIHRFNPKNEFLLRDIQVVEYYFENRYEFANSSKDFALEFSLECKTEHEKEEEDTRAT